MKSATMMVLKQFMKSTRVGKTMKCKFPWLRIIILAALWVGAIFVETLQGVAIGFLLGLYISNEVKN